MSTVRAFVPAAGHYRERRRFGGRGIVKSTRTMFLASVVLLPTLLAQPAKTRDGDWPMYNRDLAGTRYSQLTQINTGNVGKLAKVWSYRFRNDAERAVPRGNIGAFSEVTPIVVNGRMYLTAGDRQGSVALRGEGPAGLQARRAVLGGR